MSQAISNSSIKPDARNPLLAYLLQPVILVAVLGCWYFNAENPATYLLVLVSVHVLLGCLEYALPARRDWLQPWRKKLSLLAIATVVFSATVFMADLYSQHLTAPLAALRNHLSLDVWPHHWPVLLQLFVVFFLSELIWYWMHRAEHRWSFVWRCTGHGAHHSFKNLGAINFGANHPMEIFVLVLPSALVELTFGVGIAAGGAAMLVGVQASIAHANISMNTKGIGWFLTTNEYHIRHHSAVLDESNTNYGCAAIIWDRVFGTFSAGSTLDTGIGPTEPTLWEKVLMPIREPEDSAIAPR